jgi:hypothetical protein
MLILGRVIIKGIIFIVLPKILTITRYLLTL